MEKYKYIIAVSLLFFPLLVKTDSLPVLIDFAPNYSNYWLKSNQVLGFNIICQDDGELDYQWTVDGVQKSNEQSFNLNGSDYDLGNHEVKGVCDDGAGGQAEKTFNLEIIDESDFVLAVLPDTQNYTFADAYMGADFKLFQSQTNWIKEVKENLGIVFVAHEGDVVNHSGNEELFEEQWAIADASMDILDGVVPYGVAVGNHDYDNKLHDNRDTTYFNQYFSPARFQQFFPENFVGNFNGSDATHFNFDHQGLKFSVIFLPFCPTDGAVDWLDQALQNVGDRRVIFVTHSYINKQGKRIDDVVNIANFGGICGPDLHPVAIDGNTGEEIWQKVLKKYPNVFLTLNGHSHGAPAGYEAAYSTAYGAKGNKVNQVFANYQNTTTFYGGNGFLRIMRFSPNENRIYVSTYSPSLDRFLTEWNGDPSYNARNNFEFDYLMKAPAISNTSAVPGVNSARIVWSTDFESTSRVKYGRTGQFGYEVKSDLLTKNKTLTLERLSPSTRYYYSVESCDPVGNCSTGPAQNFITLQQSSDGPALPAIRAPLPEAF